LAEVTALYNMTATDIYMETVEEVLSIVASAYGQQGSVSLGSNIRAKSRINRAFDSMFVRWAMATQPLYVEAAKLGNQAAEKMMGGSPDFNYTQFANNYYAEAMQYLEDSRGLVGELKGEILRIFDAASFQQRGRSDDVDDKSTEEETSWVILGAFGAAAWRVANWAGKLVSVANDVLVRSLASVARLVTGRPIIWMVEWVAQGGRSCATCIQMGSQGYVYLADLTHRPGQDTICGARCRCVLVFWKESEIRAGEADLLSFYAPRGPEL
jgi:hypothetical protein